MYRTSLAGCLIIVSGLTAALVSAAEVSSEQDVGGQYLVRATIGTGEVRRSIYPRFRTEVTTLGEDGQARKLSVPLELYSEIRTYQSTTGDQAGNSYERAYARLVESGECRPVSSGFREASFDCGSTKGYRTVAVRQDAKGTYFSWESTATAQIPERSAFDRALAELDELTERLIAAAERDAAPHE